MRKKLGFAVAITLIAIFAVTLVVVTTRPATSGTRPALKSQTDNRLRNALRATKLQYGELPNGDCQVAFSMPDGRHQTVLVKNQTQWFGGLERRQVIAAAYPDASDLSKDVLLQLMADTASQKVGCWAIFDADNRKCLAWIAKIPADMRPTDLQQVIGFAANYAETVERNHYKADKF